MRNWSPPARFAGRPLGAPRPPPEYVDPTGNGSYEVERVLARRGGGRRTEYLVKWLGYPNEDCSWVTRRNLDCPELLAEFELRDAEDDVPQLQLVGVGLDPDLRGCGYLGLDPVELGPRANNPNGTAGTV